MPDVKLTQREALLIAYGWIKGTDFENTGIVLHMIAEVLWPAKKETENRSQSLESDGGEE